MKNSKVNPLNAKTEDIELTNGESPQPAVILSKEI
jgi:hypothetical protein